MNQKQELQAKAHRERGIDEALKETFPASDPPSFVGAGAQKPPDKARAPNRRTKAAEMAGEAIDQQADQSATKDERRAGEPQTKAPQRPDRVSRTAARPSNSEVEVMRGVCAFSE